MVIDPVCLMPVDPKDAHGMREYHGHKYYFCSDNCMTKFMQSPEIFINKAQALRLTVGVMGSADREQDKATEQAAYRLGAEIAQRGYVLITGACPGLPYECARGVKDNAGLSVGISPALSLDEHVHKYNSPSDVYDVIIYTGSGLMGREVENIRSSDMVIIVGGQSGTLGEFAIAYDEGKLIGVLSGSGGIADQIPDIVNKLKKKTGASVIYSQEPETLLKELIRQFEQGHYKKAACFCVE